MIALVVKQKTSFQLELLDFNKIISITILIYGYVNMLLLVVICFISVCEIYETTKLEQLF